MSTKDTDTIEPYISDVGPEADLEQRPSRPLTPKALMQDFFRGFVRQRRDHSGGDAEGDTAEEGMGSLELLQAAGEKLVTEKRLREQAEGDVRELREKVDRLELLIASNDAPNIISGADSVGPISHESNAMQQLQWQETPVNCIATAPALPAHNDKPVTYEEMDKRLDQKLAHITTLLKGLMQNCPGEKRKNDQIHVRGPATLGPNPTATAAEPMIRIRANNPFETSEPISRSRARANSLFEALKLLKTIVPNDMDEKFPASWCDDSAASLKSIFPDLEDRDVIELLAKRVPKKHAGINSKALLSCKNLDEFRQELVALGRQQFSTAGFGSATSFVNFVPKNIGANANGLRPLVVEILQEAEPLMALPESQLSDDMRRHFILEKILQYLPFAVADKISQAPIRSGNRSMIEDLAPFLKCPKINKEVDRHLKSLKPPGKGNPVSVNSVQAPPVVKSQADGPRGKARPFKNNTCGRCGSSLHKSSVCAWYPTHTEVPCQACIKATGYNLYHVDDECFSIKK